ncbi:VacJ family lipoprotein [bacterium]|nr:VacJ family lipoprotein [bacterium]
MKKYLFLVVLLTVTAQVTYADDREIADPIEGFNRKVFWFNEQFDTYLFKPIAQGYNYITPNVAQRSFTNFFRNLRSPIYIVSDLMQGNSDQLGTHLARFMYNSTFGLAGFIDVAKEFGLRHVEEDFGTGLGYRGVETGPYLVLPIYGPSNLRDTFGRIADSFLDPLGAAGYFSDALEDPVLYGTRALEAVNIRAKRLEDKELMDDMSLDPYVFRRSAYMQMREGLVGRE